MKKLSFKNLSIALLTFFLMSAGTNALLRKEPVSASAWSGTQTSTAGSYYSGIGDETGSTLQALIKAKIKNPNVSYDWSRYQAADEAEGDSSSVLMIYSRKTTSKTNNGGDATNWNREHTYPQSKIGSTAQSDNHHIFADDNKTNGARGNLIFGEVGKTEANRVKDMYGAATDNYKTSGMFMPNDLAKGEVARSTMYINTLYGNSVTGNFQSVELMLRWHLEHPVTNREIYRNNTVHTLQGNRNPFIDNPAYACRIWGNENNATKALCDSSVTPTSVVVSPSATTLQIGQQTSLTASVLPTTISQSVTWTSLNTTIATVSSSGLVSALAQGTTTIRATSTLDSSVYADATLTVTPITNVAVTGVNISPSSLSLTMGSSQTLSANVLPTNASNKNVTWNSSSPSVASVSTSGLVTGLSEGTSQISVTTVDGGFSDAITLTVSAEVITPGETFDYPFTSSGNASWPTTSNFGAYFGSGYGTGSGSSVGNLKSSQIVKEVVVGAQYSVTISAVTNNATNSSLVTVYGLDRNNNRIEGISASYNTASLDNSNLTTMSAYANKNQGVLSLPVSNTIKVYSFEVNFAAAGSRTLLVNISVSYIRNNTAQEALAFANFVNSDLGFSAGGNCEVVLTQLRQQYSYLSNDSKTYFESNNGEAFLAARARLAYLASYTEQLNLYSNSEKLDNIDSALILGLISGISIASYFFIKRKSSI